MSNIVCEMEVGIGHVWIEKKLHKCESIPRLLSMIIDVTNKKNDSTGARAVTAL